MGAATAGVAQSAGQDVTGAGDSGSQGITGSAQGLAGATGERRMLPLCPLVHVAPLVCHAATGVAQGHREPRALDVQLFPRHKSDLGLLYNFVLSQYGSFYHAAVLRGLEE